MFVSSISPVWGAWGARDSVTPSTCMRLALCIILEIPKCAKGSNHRSSLRLRWGLLIKSVGVSYRQWFQTRSLPGSSESDSGIIPDLIALCCLLYNSPLLEISDVRNRRSHDLWLLHLVEWESLPQLVETHKCDSQMLSFTLGRLWLVRSTVTVLVVQMLGYILNPIFQFPDHF